MAEIYAVPEGIEKPKFNWKDIQASKEAEDKYIEKIVAFIKKRKPHGKNVGEIIRFQVADGYALYAIASMRPPQLVHIDTGDAYQFQYAHLLNETEIAKKVRQEKALDELFNKHKK